MMDQLSRLATDHGTAGQTGIAIGCLKTDVTPIGADDRLEIESQRLVQRLGMGGRQSQSVVESGDAMENGPAGGGGDPGIENILWGAPAPAVLTPVVARCARQAPTSTFSRGGRYVHVPPLHLVVVRVTRN